MINMENVKEFIFDYCNDEGLDYREDYSGRGMYGKQCVAITCNNPLSVLADIFMYIMDNNFEKWEAFKVREILGEPKQDSMGYSSVLYFPKLKREEVEI